MAVAAMLAGAFAGAWLYLHHGAGPPLLAVSAAVLGAGLLFALAKASRLLDSTH